MEFNIFPLSCPKHKIEKDLERLFPKKYWRRINDILVRFGRSIGKNRKREDKIIEKINRI